MSDSWIEARCIAQIEPHRDAMLACSLGTDIDLNDIAEELSIDIEDAELERRWFDLCVARLREVFSSGTATLYRAISVDDPGTFLTATKTGKPPGCCWTWDRDCATTSLHGGSWKKHDILLTAKVTADAVDWPTTFQQHFAHPSEREVRVDGPIYLNSIMMMESGEMLSWEPRMLQA